ncbi:MAG: DUF3467 domain-containing protein [bacterium]
MEKNNLKIEINKETAEGKYANIVLTAHSHSEFIIDFAKILPGLKEANVHSRIIMTPSHAKRFMKSLENTIKQYENEHGEIKISDKDRPNIGFKK